MYYISRLIAPEGFSVLAKVLTGTCSVTLVYLIGVKKILEVEML